MQYALEIIENDLNILILSQNTLHFLDFGGSLVGRKLVQSFYRILWHFANFSNVEVHFFIILKEKKKIVLSTVSTRPRQEHSQKNSTKNLKTSF